MNRLVAYIVAAILAVSLAANANAECAQCDDGCAACATAPCCSNAGCCHGPACVECVGKAELVDVEKHCWKIECEDVCIPAVRFPWECGGNKLTLFTLFDCCKSGCGNAGCCNSGCDGGCDSSGCCDGSGCAAGCKACVAPKCGFVRTIRDLKKETYKCKECEYSIAPADKGKGCGGCDCGGAGCDGCAIQPAPPETASPINLFYQQHAAAANRTVAPRPAPRKLETKTPVARIRPVKVASGNKVKQVTYTPLDNASKRLNTALRKVFRKK